VKYLLVEKSKRVSVKPYQRKGKYVIGYTREDPRNRKAYLDSLVEKVKSLEATGRIRIEKLPTDEQQYLISRGVVFDVDRMGKPLIGYSRARAVQDLREKVLAGREKKVGEPYEIGTAFVGVPNDFKNFIEKVIPMNELKDLNSIEEFSFHNFQECKTVPPKPFLSYLEKEYSKHPDYAGMYFHDIGRVVLDKTNISFETYPSFKKRAFLHEIGHHQWWYHMTSDDRKKFISVWQNEKVSDYANVNEGEGFAEAYAEYRYGVLQPNEFPNTYHLLFEIFDKKRIEKKQNVLVEHFVESGNEFDFKGEFISTEVPLWKMNSEEWKKWKRGKTLQEITEGIHIRENGAESEALKIIASKPNISFPEITEKMGIPEGRVGGALDRLEKKGLIKKQEAIMSAGGLKPSKYEVLRKIS